MAGEVEKGSGPRRVFLSYARADRATVTLLVRALEAAGLVTRGVPPDQVMATARDLARRISLGAPMALAKSKEAMVRSNGRPLEEAFAIEAQCTKDNARTADAREGPRAFMEKRPPRFTGQ